MNDGAILLQDDPEGQPMVFTRQRTGHYRQLKLRVGRSRRRNRIQAAFQFDNCKRTIAICRLVWMYHAGRLIPDGFDIHHRDEDRENNRWDNLICIYGADHPKLHSKGSRNDVPCCSTTRDF